MGIPERQAYVEPEDRDTRVGDLILRYGVILGRRCTRGQKKRFLAAAARQFELCGYGPSLDEDSHVVRGAGSKRFVNLYAGDVDHADVLFITYYDTPGLTLPDRGSKAFQTGFRPQDVLVSSLLLGVTALAGALLIYRFALPLVFSAGILSLGGLLFVALCVPLLAFVTGFREGLPRWNNRVRNSSSLAVLFDLARQVRDEASGKKVAFAFVDEGCRSGRGLEMLRRRLGRRRPRRIYVDSLGSDGDPICLTNLRCPPEWGNRVAVRRLGTEKRKQYGDYLVCAGKEDGTGEIVIDTSSEVGTQRVIDRSSLLMALAQ